MPRGDRHVDGVLLRRDPHHLGAAPGDGAHIAVLDAVAAADFPAGGVDLGDGPGDRETELARRFEQTLGVLGETEDRAAVDALALEDAGGVVKAVGQHVQFRVAPGRESAVQPDPAVAIFEVEHKDPFLPPRRGRLAEGACAGQRRGALLPP